MRLPCWENLSLLPTVRLHQLLKLLGSPAVAFCPFVGSRFPCKVTKPKMDYLIVIWLLGYQVKFLNNPEVRAVEQAW